MKKRFLVGALVLGAAMLLGGCGKEYKNGEVVVYNWGEYINEDVYNFALRISKL